MNKKGLGNLDTIVSILLLVATLATIILQIVLSGPTSTKLETSLFSILQFIFSLAFSWILARFSLRSEFLESQKKFAISAYRRIIEISNAVNRLIDRTSTHMEKAEDETNHELDVITEIGVGIRESIRSSISDWADIIGDEIETVEKIQMIREKQSIENAGNALSKSDKNESDETVEKLKSKLPKSLKITADELVNTEARDDRGKRDLRREERKNGYIELNGFYEAKSLDKDIFDFKEGDKLQVRIGDDNDKRVGTLIAYDNKGNSVGIILNKVPVSATYYEGVNILIHYLKTSTFQIEILHIDRSKENGQRHDFVAKVLKPGKAN